MNRRHHSAPGERNRGAASGALAVVLLVGAPAAAQEGPGVYEDLPLRDSEQQLMRSSSEHEELFVRRGYRYDSSEIEGLLSGIGARLAPPPSDSYISYRFHILRDPEPNAFALPDGQVYVNTGLLALLENEAQLAALLAHEVHHTAGHHGILSYRSARRHLVAGMILGPFTLGLSDVFIVLGILGYSRSLEEEADRLGMMKLVLVGYDPRQTPRLYEILLEDPEGEEPRRSTKWSTHPQLRDRADLARAAAPDLIGGADPAGLRIEAQGYRRRVRPLSLETVLDLTASDFPRAAVALAGRLVKEDESDPLGHLVLGDARLAMGGRGSATEPAELTDREKKRNLRERVKLTRGERELARLKTPEGQANLRLNLEAARVSYGRALDLAPDLPEARRGLGLTLKRMDRLKEAGRELVAYLRARPEAVDAPIIRNHLKEITARLSQEGDPGQKGASDAGSSQD